MAQLGSGAHSKSGLLIGVKLTHILGTAVVEHLGHQGPNWL